MRILHIANFSIFKNDAVFYSTDKKISNGLIRNGHLVSDFSYRDISKINRVLGLKKIGINKMIKSLIISIDNLQPELILLGHSELINGEVLSFIREKYPKIKITKLSIGNSAILSFQYLGHFLFQKFYLIYHKIETLKSHLFATNMM